MKDLLRAGVMVGLVIGLLACAPVGDEPVTTAEAEVAESEAMPAPPAPAPVAVGSSSAPAPRQSAPAPQSFAPPAPAPRVFEVPAGTTLSFTLIDSLSTETNQPGDTFSASLSEALVIDGVTVVPRNAMAAGRVLAVDEPGRVQGRARIELVMTDLYLDEGGIALATLPFVAEAESTRTEDATKIGIGAGIGAALGGILGGGKGAATGAAIGGGTGTGVVLATRGDQIEYPSETKLDFTLGESVSIREGGSS